MKSNLLILMLLTIINCTSQKTGKPAESNLSFPDLKNLTGKWYHTRIITSENQTSTVVKQQCPGRSFWEIRGINRNLSLLKHFSSGKTCSMHTLKTRGFSYKNGIITYLEDDMIKSEKLEKISDQKFKISELTFINGESVLIENFYERK